MDNGNLKLHLKENEIILKNDSVAIINPYQIHSASKVDKNSSGVYALYLDREWIIKLQRDIFDCDNYVPFQDNIINNTDIYNEFLILCKSIFSNEFYMRKEEQIIEFMSSMMIKNCNKSLMKVRMILPCEVKEYIDKNIYNNISLDKISKQFLITKFHLIRVFKQELNLTPYQYILNQKVDLAKELLSQGMSISQVSLEAGFNDQSHLYKYFKQIFSITPKEYQDSIL